MVKHGNNPFVNIEIFGEPIRKTKIIPGTLNPYWNEDFIYRIKGKQKRNSKINFELFHSGTFSNPSIGKVY